MVKGGADSAAESTTEAQSETTAAPEPSYDLSQPQQQHGQPLSLAGAVIASDSAPTGNATYQHYLIPSVSLGGQLQNIAIPAQVALSVQQGNLHASNVTQGVAGTPSSTYAISSSQSLARILAATQGYSVVASGRPVTNLSQQQVVNNGSAVPSRNPMLQQQRTGLPMRSEGVAVRLTAVPTSSVAQQQQSKTLLLDSVGTLHLQPSDLTTIHSYSLSKSPTVAETVSHRVMTSKQCGKPPTSSSVNSSSTNFILQSVATAQNLHQHQQGVAMSSGLGGATGPRPAKRIKLEEKPPATEEVALMRRRICEYRLQQLKNNKENYIEHLTELFFLKNGGNMMDYFAWKRRISPQLLNFLKVNALEGEEEEEQRSVISSIPSPAVVTTVATFKTATPTASLPMQSKLPQATTSSHSGKQTFVSESKPPVPKIPTITSIANNRLATRQHSLSTVYDSTIGSQEEIVERAKQEAFVIHRISELRREGLWSCKRLPKVQEPPRAKAHWDYLLEEMVWLATDFAQERKWKKAAAKKCAKMVMKYHQEREQKAEKAEKEEQLKLKRIASQIAREIKQFWSSIEKLVEYKQQTRLDEKRKRALDLHLNFIVDQTEKYSSWLTQGMSQSIKMECESSDDDDFKPIKSESDDEETIDREEAFGLDEAEQTQEIKLLQEESELPIEEILGQIPSEILETPASPLFSEITDPSDKDADSIKQENEDGEYDASSDEGDDEATIEVEEREPQNYDAELKELQEEGELPIDQLYEKYAEAFEGDFEMPESDDSTAEESGESEDEEIDVEGDSSEEPSELELSEDEEFESEKEMGMEFLVDTIKEESNASTEQPEEQLDSKVPSKEITDIAADALSFQPKGNTLSTTQVCTKVPFLLKHTLREYQHIGLDWLVAMNSKKLNGILADEMGLGKTIQTIALLAHLACEKGIWGPHLIVVPTSVMLNWEIELKKWCPAFKILTYYGNPKERRLKRQGWTKPHTFHVCITSYKLVVQDHQSFRRKRWKYFILDEAQHIKNFKSQRWQMLLNFQSTCRLLLTGTPLQNSLMELWSLMHFLMPNVFQSHREFREWFVNPVSGMIEGNHEYNEGLIKRLHKILRPFLLRRQKNEVEKQLPKKYEHVIFCRLSTRQRYLYDDFMSQAKTRETLAGGNFMSVINVLMQLRKVCNHPNMFEPRPTVSPFLMDVISYNPPSLVVSALEYDPFKHVSLAALNLLLADLELCLTAFAAHRIKKFQTPSLLIQRVDSQPNPPPRCPPGKIRLHIRTSSSTQHPTPGTTGVRTALVAPARPSSAIVQPTQQKIVLMQGSGSASSLRASSPVASTGGISMAQLTALGTPVASSTPITVQLHQTQGGAKVALPFGYGRLVQTASGQHLLLTSTAHTSAGSLVTASPTVSTAMVIPQASRVTLPQPITNSPVAALAMLQSTTTQSPIWNTTKPVVRVAPMHVAQNTAAAVNQTNKVQLSVSRPVVETEQRQPEVPEPSRSLFYLDSVSRLKSDLRSKKLGSLGSTNSRHCAACPIYGRDLIEAVTVSSKFSSPRSPSALMELMKTPTALVEELDDVIGRFVFAIPVVSAPPIRLRVFHPVPSLSDEERRLERLRQQLSPKCAFLHRIVRNMCTQFPDLRLIQYDCGKLQTMDKLLWKLKTDHHRVLIFTQMTRMLDILEQFLNYHGHTYLRLDGATRVDQRQALMERFNADNRIFCFILSTRSGGVGVNLTGADTVIFYDSDWNPTMDAQAQDRCHRIGQTRDVHIYRLISEKTVEENILKKANQKRLLGDLAIEGGNFTTAFFQKNTIRDLFGVASSTSAAVKMATKDKPAESLSQLQLEHALGMAEEELDARAAKTAKAEAAAEFAEFDETIPLDADSREIEEKSQAEEELDRLMEQLTPVEKYAMLFLESIQEPFSLEQLKQAEEEIEAQKKDWELGRLKALKEEEERRTAMMEDEEESSLTYSREEATNQVFISVIGREQMPTWAPPTPPQDENDLYIDYSGNFLYEQTVMPESQLPPVYVKKDAKRLKIDPIPNNRKQKSKKEEVVHIPRSLFDRPTAAILRMRREAKLQKVKSLSLSGMGYVRSAGVKQTNVSLNRMAGDGQSDSVEWFIHEDWTILQVIQNLQDLTLGLTVLSPAHIPNWDLVADVVNSLCRVHRSPKQCKTRYENVVVPREEGKILYDTNPKKPKKVKNIYKTKNNRPMRTSQLYIQDNNTSFTFLYNSRFETIKAVANKRTPTLKPWFVAPAGKNPKHAAVLQESGINYDQPPNPVQLAAVRAERIAREKQKNQAAAVGQVQAQQQQVVSAPANIAQQQAVIAAGMQQLQAMQATQLSKAGLQAGVTTVSLSKPLGSGIVAVGTTSGTFAITKALTQTTGTSPTVIPTATVATLGSATLRAQRPSVPAAMTMQDMMAAVSSGQVRTVVTTTTAAGTGPALTAAQLQAATQRITSTGLTANSVTAAVNQIASQAAASRNLTASQVQAFRQTALLRQQQRLQEQQLKLFQVSATQQPALGGKVTVSVTSPSTTGQQQKFQQQQQVATKQRPMTEAEVVQLVKRQQQKQAAALTTAQILAQAQLQQQTQQSLGGNIQTPLVKTVSAPTSLGTSSVTIPVSAVTMAGVNINVTLPQGKAGATTSATVTQQQLRQLQIQQQLIQQQQQRKVQLQQQQKVASLAQVAKVQGKTTTQLGAVQIVQGTSAQQSGKTLSTATGMTVQQIHQVLKQVTAQSLPHAVLQVTTAASSMTSGSQPATVQARVIPVPQAGLGQSAMKQTIQVVTASPSLTANVQPTFRAVTESGLVAGTLKTTTTAGTATILKASPTVMVSGQSQAILQPMSQQQAVTLALGRASAHGQPQVQIQVQPSTTTASQIPVTIHTAATSVIPAISSIVSESVMPTTATTQFVQAAIQAAKQQQQQQQQQQRASPYTMRLRNPPKQ